MRDQLARCKNITLTTSEAIALTTQAHHRSGAGWWAAAQGPGASGQDARSALRPSARSQEGQRCALEPCRRPNGGPERFRGGLARSEGGMALVSSPDASAPYGGVLELSGILVRLDQ